jgi:hypothetical protein
VCANIWHNWGAQATTTYSGVNQVPLSLQATRMELAAGFTAKLDTCMSAYGQFGYQTTDGAGRALLTWPAPLRAPQPWRQCNFTRGTVCLEIMRASVSMAISSASEFDESRMTSP